MVVFLAPIETHHWIRVKDQRYKQNIECIDNMSWVSRVKQKLTLQSIGLMSWVSRVRQKINIGVNGVYVESVESKAIFFCLYLP